MSRGPPRNATSNDESMIAEQTELTGRAAAAALPLDQRATQG
jgi:hypothetical protein